MICTCLCYIVFIYVLYILSHAYVTDHNLSGFSPHVIIYIMQLQYYIVHAANQYGPGINEHHNNIILLHVMYNVHVYMSYLTVQVHNYYRTLN